MSNVSSHGHDALLSSCYREIQLLLRRDFGATATRLIPFSAGTHWVSTPLQISAEAAGRHDREFLAKIMTREGLRVFQEIVEDKNARFVRNGIVDLEFESSSSEFEALQQEMLFLKACKQANIFVPAPFGVFELTGGAVLLTGFIHGVPFERTHVTKTSIGAVFKLVNALRRQQLVHGDIRRDNFLSTRERGICLIDYMRLTGNVERALSYDLMSAICHLSLSADPALVLDAACNHFSAPELRDAIPFLGFITRRLTKEKRTQVLQTILAL